MNQRLTSAEANPIDCLTQQPATVQRSLQLDDGLMAHYRRDLPGEIHHDRAFGHHFLTFFLSANRRQVIYRSSKPIFDAPMAAGEFYLCPANTIDSTRWHSADETFHLAIAPQFLSQLAVQLDDKWSRQILMRSALKQKDRSLGHLLQLILIELCDSAEEGESLYRESLSTALGHHLLRRYCEQRVMPDPHLAGLSPTQRRKVMNYIQANLAEKLSLQDIAEQIGLSRSYFATQFKKTEGISTHQFVNQQRLERAKQLLKNDDSPMVEIALDCGFNSQSHFNRLFKRYVGVTPRTYQKAL